MTNEQLVVRIQAGENEADNMLALWKQNKGMIYTIAFNYRGLAEIEDLLQEGYIGLCEAVRHYNADHGALFITYATFWVKQVIVRYIESCCSTVRIPAYASQQLLKYKKIFEEYKKRYGREPSDREMQAFLDVSHEKFKDIKENLNMANLDSLDRMLGVDKNKSTLGELVASTGSFEDDICQRFDYMQMKENLWALVDDLPERQAKVLRKRYQERMTIKEIGEDIGEDAKKTRQLERKALQELRKPSKSEVVRGYFEEYLAASSCPRVSVSTFQRTWTSAVEVQLGLGGN